MEPVGAAHSRVRRAAGFTLIELLVVLLLMGMMAGMIVTQLAHDDGGRAEAEAERLADLLEHAAAEALLTGRRIAWVAEPGRYRFLRWSESAGWGELTAQETLRPHVLPVGVEIESLRVAGRAPLRDMRLEFPADGLAAPAAITLAQGASRYLLSLPPAGRVRVVAGADRPGQSANLR